MRAQWKVVLSLLLTIVLLTSCSSEVMDKFTAQLPVRKTVLKTDAVRTPSLIEGMKLITQKGHVALHADCSTGYFAVEDLSSENIWYSNPQNAEQDAYAEGTYKNWLYSQAVVTLVNPQTGVINTKNSYTSALKKDGVSVIELDDGIRVQYTFIKENVEFAIEYRLLEDGFLASLNTDSIKETDDNLIYNIKILPMFGAQYFGTDGFILVPDGCGAVMEFDNMSAQGAEPYRRHIYDNDPVIPAESQNSFQETLSLPVLGMSTASGGGLMLIADEGAADAYANGSCSRQISGYNMAWFDFDVRLSQNSVIGDIRSWNYKKVVNYEKGDIVSKTMSVRYLLLNQEQVSLTAMADVLRQYISNERQKGNTVSEKAPLFLNVLCGTKVEKSVLGIPVKTTQVCTTVEDAGALTEQLQQQGISGIQMSLQQWSKSLLNGKITTHVDPISVCGKVDQWEKLAAVLRKDGGALYMASALNFYTNGGNGISKNKDAIRDINGAFAELPRYPRDVYYPSTSDVTDRILNAFDAVDSLSSFSTALNKSIPSAGMELSDLGSVLGGDYGKEGLCRQNTEILFRTQVSKVAEKVSMLGKASNLYALYDLDAVYCLAESASEYQGITASVPFLQLTLRGIMDIGSRPINDAGSVQQAFLYCIASGMSPTYRLVYNMPDSWKGTESSDYYAADYKLWQETIVQQYRAYADVYNATRGAVITDYVIEDNGILRTVYSNGVTTLVNTGSEAITIGNVTVEAMDFILLTGEEE